MTPKTGVDGHRAISGNKEFNVLKTTSAVGGLVVAATAAGTLLTGSPASAQVPAGHAHHWSSHNHNRNVNVNRQRIIVRVRVHNRNNNVAIARNEGFQNRRFFEPRRFFENRRFFDRRRGCCNRFDDDDGFIGRGRFIGDRDGGTRAVIRGDGVFASAGDARAFVD